MKSGGEIDDGEREIRGEEEGVEKRYERVKGKSYVLRVGVQKRRGFLHAILEFNGLDGLEVGRDMVGRDGLAAAVLGDARNHLEHELLLDVLAWSFHFNSYK